MEKIMYNKLVRDKIIDIIKKNGGDPVYEIISEERCLEMLNLKLEEEVKEYIESGSVEELWDIMEVLYAILDNKKISINEFEEGRKGKAMKRGSFKERILLKEVIEK